MANTARYLRTNQTAEEKILWECLRAHHLNGWKFRRQHGFGDLIVDIYCVKAGLVIELDGGYHADPDQQAYDRERDQILGYRGLKIFRVSNDRVNNDLEQLLLDIENACMERTNLDGVYG